MSSMDGSTRICNVCNEDKPVGAFSQQSPKGRRSGHIRSTCKRCMADLAMRKYYAQHETSKERNRERYWANKNWAVEYYQKKRSTKLPLDRAKRATPRGRAQTMYNAASSRAKKFGFPCTINRQFLEDKILAGTCERSGIVFDLKHAPYKGGRNPFSPSIDKIDPTKGYTPDNTQVVAWCYNTGKGEMSDAEFIDFCKQVVRHNA